MIVLANETLMKTGATLVIVTIPGLDENSEINLYTNGLYQKWGIGKKGEDKGVLILLALKERQIRIETGYGLEGLIPDGLAGEILDKYALPHLKTSDYNKALYNALAACALIIAKDAEVQLSDTPVTQARPASEPESLSPISLIIFGILIVLLLSTRFGRSMLPWILLMIMSGGRGGGGHGGFGGGFGGFGGGSSGGGGASRSF